MPYPFHSTLVHSESHGGICPNLLVHYFPDFINHNYSDPSRPSVTSTETTKFIKRFQTAQPLGHDWMLHCECVRARYVKSNITTKPVVTERTG